MKSLTGGHHMQSVKSSNTYANRDESAKTPAGSPPAWCIRHPKSGCSLQTHTRASMQGANMSVDSVYIWSNLSPGSHHMQSVKISNTYPDRAESAKTPAGSPPAWCIRHPKSGRSLQTETKGSMQGQTCQWIASIYGEISHRGVTTRRV